MLSIMRKKRKSERISKAGFSLRIAKSMIEELISRVEKLEKVQSEVAEKNESTVLSLGQRQLNEGPKRRGRIPKIETPELLNRRKSLTTWLEQNWPYLSVALRKAKTAHEAAIAMTAAKEMIGGVFQPPFYDNPEKYQLCLWEFLQSGRFYSNPRNLAGAMAGVPELSWKRSFDICAKHSYKGGLALQAYWDYMRRNFPDRLRELSEVRTPELVRLVLARSRTKDPVYLHLKANPDKAVQWLEAGKPSASYPPSKQVTRERETG